MSSPQPDVRSSDLDRVREGARVPYRAEVRLFEAHASAPMRLLARDIAEGGVFVHTQLCFDPGALVRMEIPIPACASVVVRAQVVRVELRRDAPRESGMALAFLGLSEVQRQRIAALIEAILRPAQHGTIVERHDPLSLAAEL